MKTAYMLPGGMEDIKWKKYRRIGAMFKKKGYRIKYIQIRWNYKLPEDWLNQLNAECKPKNDDVLWGFSWGAMIAFIASTRMPVKRLVLCSLSAFFAEDLPKHPLWWKRKYTGVTRFNAFKKYKFSELAKNCKAKTTLLVGTEELKLTKVRVMDAHKRIRDNKLVLVHGSKHDVSDDTYVKEIQKVINSL